VTDVTLAHLAALGGLALAVGLDVSVFVAGPLLLRRRTGQSGWLRSAGATRPERLANLLFLCACGLDLVAPICVLAGFLPTLSALNKPMLHGAGGIVGIGGIALAIVAQAGMGVAWRTGIDASTETSLVTTGLFRIVRNPVYVGMFLTSLGISLLAPTILIVPTLVICALSFQVQTRAVEEPFLRRRHADAYLRYADRTGRFLPGLGRLRDAERGSASRWTP
jgi:protein-S-isoprenylcysteine O-methyltransferase Ste14